jgi:ketosteroid isomerase-like protein
MTKTQAETLAGIYFDAWLAGDFARLRAALADECVRGIEGLSTITTGIDIRKVFVAGDDVLTWYDLSTSVADPVPVANWMHVADGKITKIEVAFDARGIASAS